MKPAVVYVKVVTFQTGILDGEQLAFRVVGERRRVSQRRFRGQQIPSNDDIPAGEQELESARCGKGSRRRGSP